LDPQLLLLLPLWYVVFLFSITCHEAAHAWAAYRGGDPTAYLGGQVSLNPIPHMQREPFGTLVVPLISFFLFSSQSGRWMIGWASAPYDPDWEYRHPKRAAMMAAAGPAANLVLSLIGLLALKLGLAKGLWAVPYEYPQFDQVVIAASESGSLWIGVGRFCSVLFSLNLILCLFNLLPLPPMDGASVLSGFIPAARRLREQIGANPMLGLIGLVLAWRVFPFLLRPIYIMLLRWLYT